MFLDSFAWIEYLEGTPRGKQVRSLVAGPEALFTCPIVIAEVYSRIARTKSATAASDAITFILHRTALVEHDTTIALEAGHIHVDMKGKHRGFGLADAFVLAAARSRGVKVLTGDAHFDGLPEAVML